MLPSAKYLNTINLWHRIERLCDILKKQGASPRCPRSTLPPWRGDCPPGPEQIYWCCSSLRREQASLVPLQPSPTKELVNQMCQTDPSLGSAMQDPSEMVCSGSAQSIPAMTWISASRKLPVQIVKQGRSIRSEGNKGKRNCQQGFFKSKFLSILSTL